MKLLIIGNGFDKHCQLKSSFNDYFDSLDNTKVKHFFTNYKNYCTRDFNDFYKNNHEIIKELTFIEKYLLIMKMKIDREIYWADVESQLFLFLTNGKYNINKILKILDNNFKEKSIIKGFLNSDDILDKISIMIQKEFDLYSWDNFQNIFLSNNKNIYNLLKNDILSFEKKFTNYLYNEVMNNTNYNLFTSNLVNMLTNSDDYNVLNFNYTSPPVFHEKETENVHGLLTNRNIIIGIDSTNINYKDPSYIFTKTYRKVEQFTQELSIEINNVIDYDYDEIIFYGHSLNEQDYSYFQTIFDKIDLYNSEVKLTFIYNIYNDKIANNIKNDQINSVIKLIETYGESLENRFKGKNMLHRLLNTRRIEIRDIKNI